MSSTATMPSTELHYKERMDDTLWDRLVARIQKDNPEVDQHEAELIMDAAICFLLLCGLFPKLSIEPSAKADIGWHTFLMYTREYAAWCKEHIGFFVHHEPSDMPGVDYSISSPLNAVALMQEHGIAFNEAMWADLSARCRRKPGGGGGGGGGCGGGGCGSGCGGGGDSVIN